MDEATPSQLDFEYLYQQYLLDCKAYRFYPQPFEAWKSRHIHWLENFKRVKVPAYLKENNNG